jgi:hypothetical protein
VLETVTGEFETPYSLCGDVRKGIDTNEQGW